MSEIYRAQTNAGGSTAFGGADADHFGASVGRAIGGVGEQVEAIGKREEQIRKAKEADAENAAAALAFSRAQTELATAEIDGRATAGKGGAGHTDAIAAMAEERVKTGLASIKNPAIRTRWQLRYEELRGSTRTRAYEFETAAKSAAIVEDAGETIRTLSVGMQNNPNPEGLVVSLQTIEDLAGGLSAPDAVKSKIVREGQRDITVSFGEAQVKKDPRAFIYEKDGKTPGGILQRISNYLSPDDVKALRTTAELEIARLEVVDRRKAAVWEATARNNGSALLKRITAGDTSVTEAELKSFRADAAKFNEGAGDAALTVDIDKAMVTRGLTVMTKDWSETDWSEQITKREKVPVEKRTTAQNMELEQLRTMRPGAVARFNNNIHEWVVNAGLGEPPAIDLDNPSAAQGEARARGRLRTQPAVGPARRCGRARARQLGARSVRCP